MRITSYYIDYKNTANNYKYDCEFNALKTPVKNVFLYPKAYQALGIPKKFLKILS